jgi:thiamine biosynthesis lipoprotein
MGTRWSLKLVAPATAPLDDLSRSIDSALDRIIAQMSTWEADSDISRFNRATAGTWHPLPHEFFTVLAYALHVARDSEGAYDPTIGRLVDLWGFGPARAPRAIPHAAEIKALRDGGDWRSVELDLDRHAVRQPGGIHLDLSSVAKGYAVDALAEIVRDAGFANFLVEIGGELRGEGMKPDGMPWWVALTKPPPATANAPPLADLVIALNGLAVATSGSAEHAFEDGGRIYSHTIDPRTGAPVAHGLVSVSVLHAKCMHADALATALSVLGPQQGLAHAQRLGLAARFVVADQHGFQEVLTPRLAAMLA